MENEPNKEESPIYDTDYAQNRHTRVLDLEGKQPEETGTEPPRLAVGRPPWSADRWAPALGLRHLPTSPDTTLRRFQQGFVLRSRQNRPWTPI